MPEVGPQQSCEKSAGEDRGRRYKEGSQMSFPITLTFFRKITGRQMTVGALFMNYTNIAQILEASKYVRSHPPPEQQQGGQVQLLCLDCWPLSTWKSRVIAEIASVRSGLFEENLSY